MKKFLLVLILPLLLLSQGCMTVDIRMSGPQSGCMHDVKYTNGGSFIYDPLIKMQVAEKNSVLEKTLREYPDSYRYFLSSRESLKNAELKSIIGSSIQLLGSVTLIVGAFAISGSDSGKVMLAGVSLDVVGVIINLFSIPETSDSVKKLAKAIDYYNSHCY